MVTQEATGTRNTLRILAAALVTLCGIGSLTGSGALLLGERDAHAVVGRPLTPVSYAGVARRTTRRAYAAAAYVAPAPAAVVTLPAGCGRTMVGGGVYYQCGAARYQPYYDGPNLVYRPVP